MGTNKKNSVHPRETNKPSVKEKMGMPLKNYDLREDLYGPEAKPSIGKVLFTKEELEDNSKTE